MGALVPPRTALGLIVSAVLLGACTTVGPTFKAPDAPTAQGYAMAGEKTPDSVRLDPEARMAGPWWQAFGSEALDKTVRLALAENPSVAQAQAVLDRYQAEERAAVGQRGPQAELTPSIQRQKFNPRSFGISGSNAATPGFAGFSGRTFNLFSLGGRVSYDLDLFGGGRRRVEEAGARTARAAREADAAFLSLSGNVALQAMRVAGLRGEMAAVQEVADDDHILQDLARQALALGGIPRITFTQIEAQLAEDEATLPPLRRQYDEARHQLALLVGKAPSEWTPPDFDLAQMMVPAVTPVSLPSSLVRRRPDILAAEAELHAATAAVGVALADQYPSIRLSANGSLAGLNPQDVISTNSTAWTLLGGVTVPLFDGGTRKARTKAAEAQAREALARYRVTVLRAFVEVSDAMAALQTDQQELTSLTDAVARSQQAADDTLNAARLGARTASDVIQSRRQLFRDKRELARAQARRLSDLVDLYAASAADWRETAASGGPGGVAPGR